jgi:ABC-type tungstate transport system substrate-binding protein
MFLHGRGILLQVHRGGFVAVVVGGYHRSGCKVAVGSIVGGHGRYTQKGISPCCVAYRHGGAI